MSNPSIANLSVTRGIPGSSSSLISCHFSQLAVESFRFVFFFPLSSSIIAEYRLHCSGCSGAHVELFSASPRSRVSSGATSSASPQAGLCQLIRALPLPRAFPTLTSAPDRGPCALEADFAKIAVRDVPHALRLPTVPWYRLLPGRAVPGGCAEPSLRDGCRCEKRERGQLERRVGPESQKYDPEGAEGQARPFVRGLLKRTGSTCSAGAGALCLS